MANVIAPLDKLKLLIDGFDADWNDEVNNEQLIKKLNAWKKRYEDNYFVKCADKLPIVFNLLSSKHPTEHDIHLARYIALYYAFKTPFFVYKHTSPNGKIYIGITCQRSPETRWNEGFGYDDNYLFWPDIQKYGWSNIKHEILYSNLTQEEASLKEKELIHLYKSNIPEFGYNLDDGGKLVGKPRLWEYDKFHQWHKKRKLYKIVAHDYDLEKIYRSKIYTFDIYYCEKIINPYIDGLFLLKGKRIIDESDEE